MVVYEYRPKRVFLGRLTKGKDVLDFFQELAEEKGIHMGTITAVGALKGGNIGYYHQDTRSYETISIDKHLELIGGWGNISHTDGKVMIHLHVALADSEGRTYSGHLMPGNTTFAGEFSVTELDGPVLERKHDEATGLQLWT